MRHLTVIYTIHDEEAFKAEFDRVKENFGRTMGDDGKPIGRPWGITAISCDHEMDRVEAIRRAIDWDEDDPHEAMERVTDLIDARDLQGEIRRQEEVRQQK